MPSSIKNQDTLLLEEYFASIKNKENIDQSVQGIKRVLKRQFDLNFEINIVKENRKQFFGMSIYPTKSSIELFVDQIMSKKSSLSTLEQMWAETKDWVLEIDGILLYDTNLNTNPAEMVAILLHEIGHVVYSNTVIARVNKIMRVELMKLSYGAKKVVRWKRAQRIFDLVFIEACGSKNYHLKRELEADKFVKQQGYGDNLSEFIDKLIRVQGNGLIDRSESEMEKDIRTIVVWSVDNITELEYRKTKLRTTLQAEILANPSIFAKEIILNIKSGFFGDTDKNKFDSLVQEQFIMQDYKRAVDAIPTCEGFFNIFDSKTNKLKKLSQSDIDIIEIEIGRIMNQDDKIYTLDLIYDKMDIINTGLTMLTNKEGERVPMSKDTLLKYKAQLEKLRKRVLDADVQNRQYGVFVRYPKGYEG